MEDNRDERFEQNNILEIRGLTKHFKGFSLDGIDLSLPSGCIMGLMGENGSGKSTMIKLILGLLKIDGGEIEMFGKNISESGARLREDVGVVLDGLGLPTNINALQAGKLMSGLYRNWDMQQYREYLKQFRIDSKKKIKDYSKGTKMKLSLSLALSHGAKLLLLDEPTSGLDPMVREEALDILREFVVDEEHAVLISSHITSDLEKTADYAAFLHEGRLVLFGEKDRLKEEYRIMKGSREEIQEAQQSGLVEVIGLRSNQFGAEALIHFTDKALNGRWGTSRDEINELKSRQGNILGVTMEQANLEDIMLYLVRNESKGVE